MMTSAPPPFVTAADTAFIRARLRGAPGAVVIIGKRDASGRSSITSIAGDANAVSPVTARSSFEIGSITKTFTGLLLADMVRRGEVGLDDPIEKYVPPGVTTPSFGGRPITLRDLADHRSGLPRIPPGMALPGDPDPYASFDAHKLYAFLASFRLTRAPGETYEYSNLGVGLLGQLLANRANTTYAQLVRTRITAPLGMNDTVIPSPHEPRGALEPGYDDVGMPAPPWTFDALAGAAAARSTVDDLLRFGAVCLASARGALADDCRIAMAPLAPAFENTAVGLTWNDDTSDGVVWKDGETAGYRSFIGIDRAHESVAVLLANADIDTKPVGLHLLDPARIPPPAPIAYTMSAQAQRAFAGRYAFSPMASMTIEVDAYGLAMTLSVGGHARLVPTSPTVFALSEGTATLAFTLGSDGTPDGVTVDLGRRQLRAVRVDTDVAGTRIDSSSRPERFASRWGTIVRPK